MLRRAALLLIAGLLIAGLLLAGCGKERQPAPDLLVVSAPSGESQRVLRDAGMRFKTPLNWEFKEAKLPRAFTLASGRAAITGWAYERDEPLPKTGPALDDARARLLERVAYRNKTYKPTGSRVTRIDGNPAIVVEGEQTLFGQLLKTRSAHIYAGNTEYAIDALGPPDSFATVQDGVLEPLLRSLRVTGVKG
ncbi:MAG: hypothetical protein H0V29_02755 [Thermoleophilaceae bacterium]|nr:hypothetical protein [Thermoleophilaceae bacterium]